MAYEFILYEKKNRVATITLNRPEKLNALNHGVRSIRHDIIAALDEAEADQDTRCVLLTGAGRAFSSGGDMTGGGPPRQTPLDWLEHHKRNDVEHARIRDMSKPVIGVINGLCYGAGLELAAQCDVRIASDQAKFSFIEARMGNGGSVHLPFIIGVQWTKRLFFTGEVIDAQRALQIGLVTEVIPHNQLMEKAQEFGERIAAMPPLGVRLNKMCIDGAWQAMGLQMSNLYYEAVSTMTNLLAADAEAPDGRKLRDIREKEGFREFLKARNTFFDRPWP